jgi:5-methylcytosine-specific restriction endonuclease McrA
MVTVREAAAAMKRGEKPKPRPDPIKRFYSSRAWRSARYAFLKTQPRPLRCRCCGASSLETRICVDHVVPLKKDWSRRTDQSNLQLLCNDCNFYGKGSSSDTTDDWRIGS